MGHKDFRDLKEMKDVLVHKDVLVQKASLGLRDVQDLKGSRVVMVFEVL